MQITAEHTLNFLQRAAAHIKQHRDYLTDLDAAIGDADHGINLDRGFSAVLSKLPTISDKDIGTILKTAGMTLISTVGGASGPLYGTAFMRAANVMAGLTEMSQREIVLATEAVLEGIKARGKSQAGEKTMIDAIEPGVSMLREAWNSLPEDQRQDTDVFLAAMRQAVVAVEEGMRATTPMLATKGRASYLVERSIGHQDPGATSAFYIARALLETLEEVVASQMIFD